MCHGLRVASPTLPPPGFPSVITLCFPVTEAAGKLVSFSSLQGAGVEHLARPGFLGDGVLEPRLPPAPGRVGTCHLFIPATS